MIIPDDPSVFWDRHTHTHDQQKTRRQQKEKKIN